MRRHLKPLALSVSKGKQGRFFKSLHIFNHNMLS